MTRPEQAARGRGVSKAWLTVGVIAVELAVLYAVLNGGGWVYDDNLIMALAGRAGLTWGWLNSLIFQHWGLVYHLVFAVLYKLMPVDYRWALLVMLAFVGGSIYLVQRVVSMLFGWGWRSILVAAWFGLSVLFIRPLQWWAGGLQYLPNTFFDLLCVYGYIRFQIDGRRRWIAVAAGGLAGGLLFYEKPVYMLLYLALIQVLLLSSDFRPRAVLLRFWRERLMWVALVAVAVVWAVTFRLNGGFVGLTAGTLTPSDYLAYFRILWLQGFVPAMISTTLPASGMDTGQIVLAILLQVGLVAAVAVSIVRKRSAWRPWLLLAVLLVLTGVLVVRTRVAQFGVGIGADQRYLIDFSWLIPVALGYAFSTRRSIKPAMDSARLGWPRVRPVLGTLLALVIGGYLTAAVLTATMLQAGWAGPQARAWEGRLQGTLAAFRRHSGRFVLADADVPFIIVPPAFAPYNLLSWIAPLYYRGVQVDGPLHGPLVMLGQDGTARRAEIAARWDDGAVPALVRGGRLQVTGQVAVRREPGAICVRGGGGGGAITRSVSSSANRGRAPAYLLLSYSAPYPGSLPTYVDSGSGYPGVTDLDLPFGQGSGNSVLFLSTPTVRRLLLRVEPGDDLCITRIDLVMLQPTS